MKRNAFLVSFIFLIFLLIPSCGSDDGLDFEDGKLKGQATLTLLPIDLPIFPTDVTLDGLTASIKSELKDLGVDWMFSNSDIENFFGKVEKKLRNASLEILQPGVLSVAIDNQITDTIRDYVEVTEVGVTFGFKNDTDVWVSVPVEFQLFLGDGDKAEAWDESVMIPFEDDRVDSDGNFIVAPGETIELTIDNVPHLVDALNESTSVGIGYKALYRMADFDNGAKLNEIISEFGACLVEGLIAGSTSSCPDVSELLKWHLTITKFDLVIKAESELEIPEIPGCEDFADEFNLDTLKEACP